jgi:hypothetical protein
MTSLAAQPSTALPPAFHATTVIAPQYRAVRLSKLFEEPNLAAPPADDPGLEMMTLKGQRLAVFVFDQPSPAQRFQIGRLAAVCRGHRSHINVMRTRAPQSRAEAAALSRAVTLTAMAVARLVNAIAVTWTDADHIVPPSILEKALNRNQRESGLSPCRKESSDDHHSGEAGQPRIGYWREIL